MPDAPENADVREIRIGYCGPSDRADAESGDLWCATRMTVAGAARCLQAQRVEKLGTTGLVVHMDYLPRDQFLLVRFTMSCYAACAQPIVCPVRWADAATLKSSVRSANRIFIPQP